MCNQYLTFKSLPEIAGSDQECRCSFYDLFRIGIAEICRRNKGSKFLTLVYQIDDGCKMRPLVEFRSLAYMNQAFDTSYLTKLGLLSLLTRFHSFQH
ncbi:hypothetical protein AOG2_17920 [Geobacter sp. AOG2]|nr:hypothetical protein AOG2_17920 [Geobacter sp. AOG2]